MSTIPPRISPPDEYVGIALRISSDTLTAEAISHHLGLDALRSQSKGAQVANTTYRLKQHAWWWGEQIHGNGQDYLGSHSSALYDRFFESLRVRFPLIKQLSNHHSVEVAVIYSIEDMPFLGFTNEQVQAIADMGARVSFDVMIDCGD